MTSKKAIFPEIQGLRAIAVGLVVIFHIWPSVLTGGFIGVDVFFVISGYLITGHLIRAILRDGYISLIDFYARRARRLLPVATAVLIACFGGLFIFLPKVRWEETTIQIAASAAYVQNWVLAWLSVDYLGSENAASPVQHYWSLSIEEQFYFIWPLVMIAGMYFSRSCRVPPKVIFTISLSFIFLGSLTSSIVMTAKDPAQSYFITYTRIWEMALGGLLSLIIHRLPLREGWQRAIVLFVGLAAITWSAVTYSKETPFPGVAALVPTIGAAFVIIAGNVRIGLFHGLNNSLMSYIGDRSYSIYLWHWPLVTFYMAHKPAIGLLEGIGILTLTMLLSHLSYKYIEQKYRHSKTRNEWKPIIYGLTSILVCLTAAAIMQYSVSTQSKIQIIATDPRYPGPAALIDNADVPTGVDPSPSLTVLKRDLPIVYSKKCHQDQKSSEPISCVLGNPEGAKSIVIFGDSHAAQWIPALEIIAQKIGWKLITFTKSACAFSRVIIKDGNNQPYTSCSEWREKVIDKIKEIKPDYVFTTQSRYGYITPETMTAGLQSVWREITKTGAQVFAIQDTPWMAFDPGECISASLPKTCVSPLLRHETNDIILNAVNHTKKVSLIDMTDAICGPDSCETIVGNIIVWRDNNHLSATYSKMLAPYLAQRTGLSAR
ncbi:acyltransferase family protein [Brucellaceae bacterium C25G]